MRVARRESSRIFNTFVTEFLFILRGAEGTIIEGPDDLSRMIWGLGTDNIQPSHSRPDLHHTHKPTVNQPQSNFSPRPQKTLGHPSQNYSSQTRGRITEGVAARPALVAVEQDHRAQAALHQRALNRLGSRYPEDQNSPGTGLKSLPQRGNNKVAQNRNPAYSLQNHWARECLGPDWHVFDTDRGLGLNWQSTFARQNLKTVSVDGGGKHLAEYLKASAPAFVPGNLATAYSCPRIFVEPRPNELARTPLPPQRPSAFDIAHKYQQQQQLQNTLPTPPRSSSTQWSPFFTSCQESSRSPEQVNSLPPRLSVIQAQQPYSTGDPSQQLRRFVYERMGDMDSSESASPVQIDPSASPHFALQYSPDVSVSLAKFLRHRSIVSSPSFMSPPHPGPPPNTPLPPVPNHNANYYVEHPPLFAAPPSPTSPETRARSLSYQQPRSIPLARLIQRRLSSVPEEDLSSFVECTRSPSPLAKLDSSSCYSQSHWQQLSAVTQISRTPSPVPVPIAVAPQTRALREDDTTIPKKSTKSVRVKLPNPSRMNNPGVTATSTAALSHQRKKLRGKKVKTISAAAANS